MFLYRYILSWYIFFPYRDTFIFTLCDLLMNILSAVVVFSILGIVAEIHGVDVTTVGKNTGGGFHLRETIIWICLGSFVAHFLCHLWADRHHPWQGGRDGCRIYLITAQ